MSAATHRQGAAAPPPNHRSPGPRSTDAAPPLRSLVELVRRRSAEDGRGAGYLFLDDQGAEAESLGWSDLDCRARAIAAALAAAGAAPGDRALLLHPPGLAFVAAFFGCLYAGVVAVPGYPPRSRRGLPRVAAVTADSGARLALTTAEEKPKFEALTRAAAGAEPALAPLAAVEWLASDRAPVDGAEEWEDPGAGPETLAFLQYTSGSTAAPKGVMVSHGNLLHNQEAIRRAFAQSESSVVVGWLPLYHDMGLIGNVLQPLYAGARCVLMSPIAFLQRPRLWLETITRYRGTTSGGPNFAYELCAARVPPEERAGLDLSSWTVAFNGAEPVRAATLDRFAAAFAPCGFRRRAFLPCYGLAEATLLVAGEPPAEEPRVAGFSAAALERGRAEEAAGEGARPLVACGGAAGRQRLEVVDPETGHPRGPGEVGEIWVAGPSVAAGYWRRPEETAEAFGARLAGAGVGGGGRFLRTGDLGFLSGGRLFVTGRIKDLVIVRGRNHYPHDLERTAEASHPALRAGCGAAFAVDRDGEDRLVIAQEVEREAVRTADPAALAAAIRAAVAEGHDLEVEAVALLLPGGVPKTSSGKVQRRACRRMYEQGTLKLLHHDRLERGGAAEPAAVPEEGDDAGRTPAGPAEPAEPAAADLAALTDLVRREAAPLLRVAVESLEDDRPLPLDSLAAMELKARLEGALGVALPLEGFFDGPTPRSLARAAAEARAAGEADAAAAALGAASGERASAGPAAPGSTMEPEPAELPLSPGQSALWFVDRLARAAGDESAVAAYHVAVAVRAPGGLDRAALAGALARLAGRHPALTATFHDGEDGPVQRSGAAVATAESGSDPCFLAVVPAGDLDAADLGDRLAAEAARPFDLETGPPFRAVLFRAPDGDVLLLAFHHLAVDLWSLVVLAEDLAVLYPAALAGEAPPKPPAMGLRRADWLRRQEEVLAGPEGARLAAFWRAELAGAPAVLELPTDRPRPPVQSFRAGSVALRLAPAEWSALERLAAGAGATPFAALLLYRHS